MSLKLLSQIHSCQRYSLFLISNNLCRALVRAFSIDTWRGYEQGLTGGVYAIANKTRFHVVTETQERPRLQCMDCRSLGYARTFTPHACLVSWPQLPLHSSCTCTVLMAGGWISWITQGRTILSAPEWSKVGSWCIRRSYSSRSCFC